MVRVPKGLKRLLSDSLMGGRVHEHHAKEHHMACYPTSLGIMNLDGQHGSDVVFFNVVKAARC